MKKQFFFTTAVLLVAYLLSACGGALQPAEQPTGGQAAQKVQAVEVAFTGVVEAMNGNEWTVNGQALSVDPTVVRDGPFQAGDTIKVEGTVNSVGSLSVSRVEAPSAADLTDLPQLGNDNANDNNSNDVNANANSNDDNSNDANANANSNDDNSNDDGANGNTSVNSNDDDGNSNNDGNSNDDDGDSGGGNGNDSSGHGGGDDDDSNSNDD